MVGAFEDYLHSLMAECLAPLNADPPPIAFASLPETLRVSSVFDGLERAMKGPLHGAPGKRAGRLPEVIHTADRISRGHLLIDALSETGGNPNSARLKDLLKVVGMEDPYAVMRPRFDAKWARPESATFVQDKLDEIVTKRHSIAHGANVLNIARTDLAQWPGFLRTLAETVDDELQRHVATIIAGGAP
jgi:hypothetical protein